MPPAAVRPRSPGQRRLRHRPRSQGHRPRRHRPHRHRQRRHPRTPSAPGLAAGPAAGPAGRSGAAGVPGGAVRQVHRSNTGSTTRDYRDVDGMQWPFRLRRATGRTRPKKRHSIGSGSTQRSTRRSSRSVNEQAALLILWRSPSCSRWRPVVALGADAAHRPGCVVTVVDPSGAVIPDATVTIVGLDDATKAAAAAPVKTTDKGIATFENACPGPLLDRGRVPRLRAGPAQGRPRCAAATTSTSSCCRSRRWRRR